MAYTKKFKWTDELVKEFTNMRQSFHNYTLDEQISKFQLIVEERLRLDRIKRTIIGKRGMNEDGSRFYFDSRGVKWTFKRETLANETYYLAESNVGEAFRTKFLGDVYLKIDNKDYKAKSESIAI